MIKVLVVDDHDLIRAGIARMLEDDGSIKVLGEACSGEEAVERAQEVRPDVVVMDLKMPGIGGLEAMRRIQQRCGEQTRVVVVSAYTEDPYPSRVMDAGASAFISKNSHISEMIRAIKMVANGQRYVSPDIAQAMALNKKSDSPFDCLSERELQIATMIMDCQKVQDISDKLCLSPKTVNSYRYRIFEKLDINSDVELTLLAVRNGLLEVDGPQ
ncbi:MAG: UvrY/SirA/GacA family response regulator transcription factor [Oleiphilaceae bacterium]|nr:UvrY/SirA/GacA family response regulator transcription factor [Oleiphilaceae bacterium]